MPTLESYTIESWITSFRTQTNVISDFVTKLPIASNGEVTILMDESLLSKYTNELAVHKAVVDLTEREREFYAYNPRLFSYDLYGVPEFWYLILHANEMVSALQFNESRIYIYKQTVINMLNVIRQLELDAKNENEQEITDIVVNNQNVNQDVLVPVL